MGAPATGEFAGRVQLTADQSEHAQNQASGASYAPPLGLVLGLNFAVSRCFK